jgi:hypothetical protein
MALIHHIMLQSTNILKRSLILALVEAIGLMIVCRTQLFEVKTSSAYSPTVADSYQSAEVAGIDVNAIVMSNYVAPNLHFIQDDVEDPWTYKENSLDFVHASRLVNSIKDRKRLFSQIWQ